MSPDPVRDEAERLVAAAIAAVSVAARGMSGGAGRPSLATGGAECCICPVCRVIAAMREPSPELAERIATGAGDLAVGVTSLLRAFARPGTDSDHGAARDCDEGDQFWESLRRQARPGGAGPADDPWHTATAAPSSTPPSSTTPSSTTAAPPPAKKMAKKVAKKVAKKAVKKAAPERGGE